MHSCDSHLTGITPMRFLPTRVHGVLDWILAPLLIALPWLLGFADGGAETWVPVLLGVTGLIVTFFTDHELGVVRRIPMIGHLWVDGLGGLLLAASPWLFGFSEQVCVPHVVLGVAEFGAALVTKTIPADGPHGGGH
ncbi:MAG: SPW repeat protein [Gemmatimonadota bacterium]|nr:SPW repeat protein [Gemmatimonadota bacterium]